MRRQLARKMLFTGAVVVGLSLAVPAAMAAGTWTVTGGPNFTLSAVAGTTFTLTDTTTGLAWTCTVASGAGTITDQTMSTNTAVGRFTNLTFGSASAKCKGPLGSTAVLTQELGSPTINPVSFSGGVTSGTITGLDLQFAITATGTCTATIAGTAGFRYTDSTHLLQLVTTGDNLTVTGTSGACAGIIKVGDKFTISSGSGGFILTGSPSNPIQLSQP